jgi:4-carboxymuconolactone decarboxylase
MNWLPRFGIAAVIAVLVGMSGPAQTQQTKEPPAMAKPGQTRAQQLMGDIAPKLTISALIAMNRPDQLRSHLALARQNGVTETEIVEAITHLAFYTGWPNAVSAVAVAREVFAQK